MSEPNARWRLTCSCGWHTEISQQWAAESAAKLHSKLGESDADHIVQIQPPDQPRGQPELPLA